MNIVLVGNYDLNENGRFYYGILQRLANGFVRLGHNVYVYPDRDIARAATIFHSKRFGVGPANARLVETCRNLQPELVLLGHCELIRNATLAAIRQAVPGVRIVYRNVDPLSNPTNVARIAARAPAVDGVFVTTAGEVLRQFAFGGNFVAFMPNPVDASIDTARSFAEADQPYDVFFAASARDERGAFVARLEAALPHIRFDLHGIHGRPPLHGRAYFDRLAQARMGLNLSRTSAYHLYASDRMAHYTGNGLLTLTDRAAGFATCYAEDELAFYDGFDDLVSRIAFYAANDAERRRVAENGWRKAHAAFNERRVAQYILEQTFGGGFSEDYAWPVEAWRGSP